MEQTDKRLFKLRRVDHKNAVDNIRKMDNYEKQYNMVKIVTNQLFMVSITNTIFINFMKI